MLQLLPRRAMLAGALAGAAGARIAWAAERQIGWISTEPPESAAPFLKALRDGVARRLPAGAPGVQVIERNVVSGGAEAVARTVEELQKMGVQLIVSQGAALPPVAGARPTVPVVFGYSGDPVAAGVVQSLANPGGKITGMSFMSIELMPKRIDLLRQALPACRRIALISNSLHAGEAREVAACQQAVQPSEIRLSVHLVKDPADLKTVLGQALDSDAQAILTLPSALMVRNAPSLAAACIERRMPLISGWSSIARSGALMTYGPNLEKGFDRVAYLVLRVLGGAAPASLPVEQPSEFELAINLKTAAALGIAIPASLQALADELIE